jgi:uncharacterized protein (TIGR02646 family)
MTVKLSSKATYSELKEICTFKSKSLIKDSIYRDSYDTEDGKRSFVEDQLSLSYNNKCAYCERICKADIEHYRPKKAVDEDNKHDGYYWLCYEWTNLIPACITCNRDGAKHNKFPILGRRVRTPTFLPDGELDLAKFIANSPPLVKEMPFLLHPEVDLPDNFFIFKVDSEKKGIRIEGIDRRSRGKKTIEICRLNRQELVLDRRAAVIDDFLDGVRGVFAKFLKHNIDDLLLEGIELVINVLIEKSKDETKSHTLLRKYIVKNSNNFEKIVVPFMQPNQGALVLKMFKDKLSGAG